MNLTLETANAKITNLNVRAESHGDEKEPACDIDIACELDADVLGDITGMSSGAWTLALFDDNGHPSPHGITDVKLSCEFTEQDVELLFTFEGELIRRSFLECKVKKFKFAIEPVRHVSMKFQVQTALEPGDLDWLSKAFACGQVSIKFKEPAQGDLLTAVS